MSSDELDRGAELRIKGHLREIEEVNDEVMGGRQGYHLSEQGYERTLIAVRECADTETLDNVAEWLKSEMETAGRRPKNRKFRKIARAEVTEAGYPSNKYLNRA